ncbi:unnamed protein product [Ilex paraguariensis]|uniref:Histone-lysine N-methyltransferase n=1 Tax=Ilex paraguariensis TaxID=185542 RepID=A0ABC8RQK7_9AQUA
MIQEPIIPWHSNNLSHTELGSSFLSLLSGPPSLLQCDLQDLSNPKSFSTSSKVPVNSSSVIVSAAGSGVSVAPNGLLSQNLYNRNLKAGIDLCPVVSSRAAATGSCRSASGMHDVLQAANLDVQKSELAKAGFRLNVLASEKAKGYSFPNGALFTSSSPANVEKHHGNNVQESQNVPSKYNSSGFHQSSSLTSGCPRVFCLGASGDLLLSNTGLLGVVCSCHGLHMSLSKFSKHAGLRDVNPGNTVHVDSGETVAQWRKIYFHKFGIRVPEDHSGWDWPEGISENAESGRHSATMLNMCKNSDLPNQAGLFGALLGSGEPWRNVASQKNSLSGQRLVNEVLYTEKQRTAQDSCNFLSKNFTGMSQFDLHTAADTSIIGSPLPGYSAMSKLVSMRGPENGYHSIAAYTDSNPKSGNSFISLPKLRNLKLPCEVSDVGRVNSSFLDRDTVPSHIELRLGQPSQQSQTFGSPILQAFGTHSIDTNGDSQKSLFPEQLMPKSNTRVMAEGRQYLQCPIGTSNPSARREQSPLNLVNYASRVHNPIDASETEQFKGDAARGSLISMLLPCLKRPAEGKIHSKATNNVTDASHAMSGKLHCGSIANCGPISFPWIRDDRTGMQSDVNVYDTNKYMNKGKGVGCDPDGLHLKTETNFIIQKRHKEILKSSSGVADAPGHHNCSVVHDNNLHLCHFSGMPTDTFDARNSFNCPGNFGRKGNFHHGFPRSVGLPLDSGPILPLQAASMRLSSTNSISLPDPTPALSNKGGISVNSCMLDENLRTLALRHVLSNQDHAIASLGNNQEKGRFSNSCVERKQGADTSTLKVQGQGPILSIKRDASEVAKKSLQSGATYWTGGYSDKLAPVADANKWSDFSTFFQGTSLHAKDVDMLCQHSRDPHSNDQPLLRLGRCENSNVPSNEHGKCCQRLPYTFFPGKCSCVAQTNYLAGNCGFKGETSLSAPREDAGSVGGRASTFFTSKHHENNILLKEKANTVGQTGEPNHQNHKEVECHAFQWRDVPRKVTGMCTATCKDQPADFLNGREKAEDEIVATAAAKYNRYVQDAKSLKEQEVSNISSGGSAPAVTQASTEVNKDSCALDAGNTICANSYVVDEGSGIDRCWSSDDGPDSERSAEFLGVTCNMNPMNKRSSKAFAKQSSRSLIDELRLRDSLRANKVRNRIINGFTIHEKTNLVQKHQGISKTGRRKRGVKWKKLDASFLDSGLYSAHNESPTGIGNGERQSHSSGDIQMILQPNRERSHNSCSIGPSLKRKISALSSCSKIMSQKRDLNRLDYQREGAINSETHLRINDNCLEISGASARKRLRLDRAAPNVKKVWRQEPHCNHAEMTVKRSLVDYMMTSSSQTVTACLTKARPVACGKYGVISNGNSSKPVKIVSLTRILKSARKSTWAENDRLKLTTTKGLKKISIRRSNGCAESNEFDPGISLEETEVPCSPSATECDDTSDMLEKGRYDAHEKSHSIPGSCPSTRLKPKYKEVRKRSLYELTAKGKASNVANFSAAKKSKYLPQPKCNYLGKFITNAQDGTSHASELCNTNTSTNEHCCQYASDLDAFCCVCGSSNKDEINCLLECNQCFIRVHQACYGVSKVPKVHWYCRPCRTSSKNIVCVLCGYGGGAMTRALRSRNIVKSLLKAWNFVTESVPKNPTSHYEAVEGELNMLTSSRSGLENDTFPVIRPTHMESSPATVWKVDLPKPWDSEQNSYRSPSNSVLHNSITAGVLDPTVKQWVHMVCGLWTPETRCPNVDTMSAFDVSGARPKAYVVCSICDRAGGSCIQCRVVDCSVQFHPWCAHQKGLLQSEVEGVDNENVGFYGRCMHHASVQQCNPNGDPFDSENVNPGEKEFTCARTEGYKGRKREGFRHNFPHQSNGSRGCFVPPEQLNAWLHIIGQKSGIKGVSKLETSEKQYARYKHSKGWKHLVVYKSGIHALGLYTSRFISRGAMVVEYVGEIVGLRVADKRESEYQSGRKLQYKSACYFFRIDKEHIIDATQKGGIARFVNHSCLPNCVAKVISLRNEKKVVFFAERDIYPGEEITYDYHFNHEDEGKKIPCFCNSKNCRRYLN